MTWNTRSRRAVEEGSLVQAAEDTLVGRSCAEHASCPLIYDKFLHAAFGYGNGVFTAFIQPWQKVLAKTRNRSTDDAMDVIEQGTSMVIAGLAEAANYQHTALKSPSSKERLPNDGETLLPPTSPYYTGIDKLSKALDTDDAGADVFSRRFARKKALEDVVSSGAKAYTSCQA